MTDVLGKNGYEAQGGPFMCGGCKTTLQLTRAHPDNGRLVLVYFCQRCENVDGIALVIAADGVQIIRDALKDID